MLGTVNLAQQNPDTPEEVAKGIQAVIATIRKNNPTSKILLLSILPNGNDPESEVRKSILATNKKLADLADKKEVVYKDIHDKFIDKNGKWQKRLTIDHTHLSAAGYEVLYKAIEKDLEKLAEEKSNR